VQDRLDYVNTRIFIEEMITLGDIQFEAGLYDKAIASYQMARTTAVNVGHQNSIQTADLRLGTARAHLEIAQSAEARADADLAATRAADAAIDGDLSTEELAQLFEDVARQYDAAGMPERAAEMRARAESLRLEATVSDRIRQEQVASDLEARGDEALRNGYYERALAYYQAAEVIFIGIDATVRIHTIAQKIIAVNDLIRIRDNPPTPAPTPPPVIVVPPPSQPQPQPPPDPPPSDPPTTE
jgi:tetratricopeptide (TPR) repeat protein